MTDSLLELGLETLPLLLLAAILAAFDRSRARIRWLAAALLLVAVHEILVTRLLWQIPWTAAEGRWNWLGKLAALAASLAVAALPVFGWRRCGITLRQAPGSGPAWLVAAGLCLVFLAEGLVWDKPSDPGTLAFMWTVPGPEEEIFYRGLLLAALDRAFTARRRILGAEMGWAALVTSVQFGAVHGISFTDGEAGLNPAYLAHTLALGLAWAWVRQRTGSLLAPVLGHSFDDGIERLL
jgi:CAAX protease family protein